MDHFKVVLEIEFTDNSIERRGITVVGGGTFHDVFDEVSEYVEKVLKQNEGAIVRLIEIRKQWRD